MKQAAIHKIECSSVIESIRSTTRLSQEAFARALGVSMRTVVRWEKEGDAPPHLEKERLELIHELVQTAAEMMEQCDIPAWFSTPKEALSGERPVDLFSTYRGIQQVREILEKTRWGIF